jgi:hypothetical protein
MRKNYIQYKKDFKNLSFTLHQGLFEVNNITSYNASVGFLFSRTLTSVKRPLKIKKEKPIMFSFKNAFKDNIRHEPMVSLGNSFELLRLVKKLGWRVISACTDQQVSLFRELKILKGFAGYLLQMQKHHGATTTVKYLKSCHLAIQKCISKDQITSLRDIEPDLPLPRLTTSRLPRFIPLSDRRAIISGSVFRTRYWLTLYSLYRVIKVPGKLKLQTITDPFSGDLVALLRGVESLREISQRLSSRFNKDILSKEFGLLPLETASPTAKSSWNGWLFDVHGLIREHLDHHVEELLLSFKQTKLFLRFQFIKDSTILPRSEPLKDRYPSMGQLAIKEEAAGKLRVFALVDVWTQSCLKPLHEMIFAFLKSLPNDATFDQQAAVKRAAEKVDKYGQSFGYDLSAATDRLPIVLQEAVLIPIIGVEAAAAWRALLTQRTYRLLFPDSMGTDVFDVKYEVGQPMGALSSWAMLALTHHLIVQLAYHNIRGIKSLNVWYSEYELLGDDIVLFEKDIAEEYLRLMKDFGVGINLSKSIVSKNKSFEFAKVSWINGAFVSAISWKMFISQNNAMGRVNILFQLLPKMNIKHPIRYIKTVTARSLLDLGAYKFNLLALLSMMANSGKITIQELLKTMMSPMDQPKRFLLKDSTLFMNEKYAETLITDILNGRPLHLRADRWISSVMRMDVPWYHIALLTRITKIKLELGSEEQILKRFTGKLIDHLCGSDFIHPGYREIFHDDILSGDEMFPNVLEMRDHYWFFQSLARDLLGDLTFYDTGSVDQDADTLTDLIKVNEKFDRLLEVLKLFDRANDKLKGIALARLSDKSPLKVLQFVKRSDFVRNQVVKNERKGWFVDRSEEHFVEDLNFLLQNDESLKKVRVRYL